MSKSGNLDDFWKVCFRYTFLRNLIVVLILSRTEFLWKSLPEKSLFISQMHSCLTEIAV